MEKVLCINRNDIPSQWLKKESAIKTDADKFFSNFSNPNFPYHWIDRSIAENDTSFKQIIPYIILQSKREKSTASYRRKGSENRLHGLWSIGIGGHINYYDSFSNDSFAKNTIYKKEISNNDFYEGLNKNFMQILYSGMKREFNEEVSMLSAIEFKPIFLGIINEDITNVGKVHFGVVFKVEVESEKNLFPKKELADFHWVKTNTLLTETFVQLEMEIWSQLAVQLFVI